jgi:hypothetical protein
MEILRCAWKQDCHWSVGTCFAAAGGGYPQQLRWDRDLAAPGTGVISDRAARGGHRAVVLWVGPGQMVATGMWALIMVQHRRARERSWVSTTAAAAAAGGGGHVGLLRWFRSKGVSDT